MSYRTPLETRLAKKTTRAITDFNLVEDGDRVMVGLSGGKDSWALIQILDVLRQRAPITFSIVAVNVDSGYEGYQTIAAINGVGSERNVPIRPWPADAPDVRPVARPARMGGCSSSRPVTACPPSRSRATGSTPTRSWHACSSAPRTR
ncbi:MAG: hypothetical protein OEW19_08215 [Acidobacteriota bacterium]|nr:hypothetical protein [Acidobacteriota bacterium]